VDIRYSDIINNLTAQQKVQLRSIAQKYNQNIKSDKQRDVTINKLYQTRINIKQQSTLNTADKRKMDITLQYLIYELTNNT